MHPCTTSGVRIRILGRGTIHWTYVLGAGHDSAGFNSAQVFGTIVSITQTDQRKLFQLSGNRCAFPGCPRSLVHPETAFDDSVVLSEVAHIVARSHEGPRGHHPLPLAERDTFANLILLCEEHHHIVDA